MVDNTKCRGDEQYREVMGKERRSDCSIKNKGCCARHCASVKAVLGLGEYASVLLGLLGCNLRRQFTHLLMMTLRLFRICSASNSGDEGADECQDIGKCIVMIRGLRKDGFWK